VKRELMNEYCCQSMYTYLADACTVSFLLDINVSVCHSVQPELVTHSIDRARSAESCRLVPVTARRVYL